MKISSRGFSWFPWFLWLLEILEFEVLKRGLFSNFHLAALVFSVVLVVSSVKKKTNHLLPKQPPSSTPKLADDRHPMFVSSSGRSLPLSLTLYLFASSPPSSFSSFCFSFSSSSLPPLSGTTRFS